MIIHPGFVGTDVSKHFLDIFDSGRSERVANTVEAAAALARRWHGSFVLFEATGRYDARLRKALEAEGISFARVNPARARDFARATGRIVAVANSSGRPGLNSMSRRIDLVRQQPAYPWLVRVCLVWG